MVGANDGTQHSTTGISPFMMLACSERAIFYPEYEVLKTCGALDYVREIILKQQELNELCRRNTAHVQMRQRKNYDEKKLQAKP